MRSNRTLLIVFGILGLVFLSRMMGFGHMGLMGRSMMNYGHIDGMNRDYNRSYYGNKGYGYYNNGKACR